MAKQKYVVEPKHKLASFTGWTLAIIAVIVVALGSLSMLATAKNVDSKVANSGNQIIEANELNLKTKEGLAPSFAMNDKATVIGDLIQDTLDTMVNMKAGLSAMLEATRDNNAVLADLNVNTGDLTAALNSLVPYINALADSVDKSNVDTVGALDVLTQINAVNAAIGDQMAQIDAKLSNSLSYKLLFSVVLPILPI